MLLNLKDNNDGYGYTRRLSGYRCAGLSLSLTEVNYGLHCLAALLQPDIH